MIQLAHLNKQLLVVNAELIKFIERAPDTVLTLVTGEKVVVRESIEVILQKIAEFDPRRPSAAGYAEFHPAASNDTPEGRVRNRGVDVVILNPVRTQLEL